MESFLLFHLLPFDDSSRISDDCTSIRHVSYNYRSRSDDDMIADIDSFFDDRIRPDKTPFSHCYITCQNGSRSNMGKIPDHAFMLHHGRSVKYHSRPDIRKGVDRYIAGDKRSGSYFGRKRDAGTWIDNGKARAPLPISLEDPFSDIVIADPDKPVSVFQELCRFIPQIPDREGHMDCPCFSVGHNRNRKRSRLIAPIRSPHMHVRNNL